MARKHVRRVGGIRRTAFIGPRQRESHGEQELTVLVEHLGSVQAITSAITGAIQLDGVSYRKMIRVRAAGLTASVSRASVSRTRATAWKWIWSSFL